MYQPELGSEGVTQMQVASAGTHADFGIPPARCETVLARDGGFVLGVVVVVEGGEEALELRC